MIVIKNYKKKYSDFSLQIESLVVEGVLVLRGKNGSGKTTLFRSIMGFNRYSGSIIGESNLLTNQDYPELFIPSDFLKLFGVVSRKRYKYLSKGQKQRLKIDIAFKYENILLDEPMDGLDVENKQYLLDLIRNTDKTVLIATHSDLFDEFDVFRI